MQSGSGGDPKPFSERFAALRDGHQPFRWQERLFEDYFAKGDIPPALDIPTGLGKTSVMAIWYLARTAGAALPRRLVYVVDRRAVVDQATEEANKIKENAGDTELRISTLRGQYADNREWLEDPAAPAIIVGTVDMIGSRLLFEGYRASRGERPYMAGLLGVDTLVVLDESHLVPPFEKLLKQIERDTDGYGKENAFGPIDASDRDLVPRFRLLPLSATGGEKDGGMFKLTSEDRDDTPVKERLDAEKRLRFDQLGEAKLENRLAEEAWELCDEGNSPARILIYSNSREVAGRTVDELRKLAKPLKLPDENFQLFVGARRVKEREDAKDALDKLGFFSKKNAKDEDDEKKPAFVIATSAGEVGVDLDADHMAMDLVPFERMVQRLGRVNRLGGEGRKAEIVVIEEPDKSLPDDLKERAQKAAALLRKLPLIEDDVYRASPAALTELKDKHDEAVKAATTPAPLYPALTRALVDAWSMTSLKEHTGRPEIQPWLRGWLDEAQDPPQTTLVWRTHLPVRTKGDAATPEEIDAYFTAARPHVTETLEAATWQVQDWLKKRVKELLKAADKQAQATAGEEPETETPVRQGNVAAFVLGRGNDVECKELTLAELGEEAARDAKTFKRSYGNKTFVLDARICGLSGDGLLDSGANSPVPCADSENGWLTPLRDDPDKEAPLVPFRVRRVRVKKSEEGEAAGQESAPEEGEGSTAEPVEDERWRVVHAFDAARDGEGKPEWQLVVEKWRDADTTENARSIMRVAQGLAEHQQWAEGAARKITGQLPLPEDIANAIVLAAAWHDEGKRAAIWQQAFNAPRKGGPYAKTKGPFRNTLHGYRHEFGSLLEIEKNNTINAHPECNLILHLIAAHHGYARPIISTAGCDQAPPSALEEKACEVALRFARLQKRFGPWGLAWLEALMRAADRQASKRLEDQARGKGKAHGKEDGDG